MFAVLVLHHEASISDRIPLIWSVASALAIFPKVAAAYGSFVKKQPISGVDIGKDSVQPSSFINFWQVLCSFRGTLRVKAPVDL